MTQVVLPGSELIEVHDRGSAMIRMLKVRHLKTATGNNSNGRLFVDDAEISLDQRLITPLGPE
ncbi:hypothetical protein GCM10022278_31440 [Allohahella marinimesophila]|uniref:Uncharacterized protein n=1 Tax=Allohahella marinimesophila TaxID=1054972 RepID=A0ABP7PVJ8_9GAMM